MNLNELLTELSQRKVNLWAESGQLRIRAKKGSITPELHSALAEYKSAILTLLHQNPVNSSVDLPQLIPSSEERFQPFPLTDMQHAFWIGRSGVFELGNVANHGYYEIEGQDLDLERLNRTLQILIERHDMLRAVMLSDGRQQILSEVPPYRMKVMDLRGQDEIAVSALLEAIRAELSHQVLPTDRFPLFEFRATLLDLQRVRLHVSYDLQIFDAWSLFRLFEEWFQLYHNPDCTLPRLELSFRDYVLAEQALQETDLYQRSKQYWFDRLDTFPPAPDLPLIQAPQTLKTHHCERYRGELDVSTWQQLRERAAQVGLTPTGILLAAFAEVIGTWSATSHFALNLALFNRLPFHSQVNDILGDFTSSILLAVDHSKAEPFADRALRLQQQLWCDLEHRYISGVQVTRELARHQGRAPIAVPIVFTSTLGFGTLGQEASALSRFGELIYGISQASQVWFDHQVFEQNGVLKFNWDVVEALFPAGLIEDMFNTYIRFLRQLATTEEIWQMSYRNLIPASQLSQRQYLNNIVQAVPDCLLQQLFADRVEQQPGAIALITTQRQFTYREIFEQANQVAHRLRRHGVKPNMLVAVVMEKGWEQVVAVMGILIAGAAYLPLDAKLPSERLSYCLEDSQSQIILTQSWLRSALQLPDGIEVIYVDRDLVEENIATLQPIQKSDDLAYVIYTSGSTGLPKGVMISHRNVVNMVVTTNQRFQVGSTDRILALTALNHDLSVYDIFGLLSAGGTLVIPDADKVKDARHWLSLAQQENVTLWNSVPAMMGMLTAVAQDQGMLQLPNLRLVILGGDWLPLTLPEQIRLLLNSKTEILSIGGPTETTVWNISYLIKTVDPSWKSIPYGQPMANAKYHILNENLQDCPVWVPGEMYAAGAQLAQGYWRNQEKTQTNFIEHPKTGERLYRTGDRGRYLPDGNIEFLGRADFQVKLRGYRIELGEIEAALTRHSSIYSAVVMPIGESQNQSLAAYLVLDQQQSPQLSIEKIAKFLKQKLPDYMVPSSFVFLDKLPLSPNGKVDRKALSTQSNLTQTFKESYVAPENQLQIQIVDIWKKILNLEKIGIYDNFFDLGGNSLLITQVYSILKQELPELFNSISVIELFKYPTVNALVDRLNQTQSSVTLEFDAGVKQKAESGRDRLRQRSKRLSKV